MTQHPPAAIGSRIPAATRRLRKRWRGTVKRARKATRRARKRLHRAYRRWHNGAVLLILTEQDRPYFWAEWLAWVERTDPALHKRIRLDVVPAKVGRHTRLLHAWVQDPVLERDAELFGHLEAVEAATRAQGGAVVNPARALSNSRRDLTFDCLTRANIRTPRIVEIDESFGDDMGGLSLPVVVRQAWGHQRAMRLLETPEQVREWLASSEPAFNSWIAAEYIDVQDPDGLFRKYRYILFGDHGVCRHIITSASWEVRPGDRILTDEVVAEELEYLANPCPHHEILRTAQRELQFDIAAFDYSFDASGELIVWEVNPYPDISTPSGPARAHLGESVENTFRGLAALYRDRLRRAGRDWVRWRPLA